MWDNIKEEYYSPKDALERVYPEFLATRPDLQAAITAIKMAEAYIDVEMRKLDDNDGEED